MFALADLDWLLRIDGAASAIERLRDLYGAAVRAVLDARCLAIIAPRANPRGKGAAGESWAVAGVDPELATSGHGDDEAHSEADDVNDGDGDDHRLLRMPGLQMSARNRRPRITVGIASRGAH